MAAAKVLVTEHTLILVGDGAGSEVFTAIGQVLSFDGPHTETAKIAKTHLGSTSKEYRPSQIPDNGELAITIEYDPTNAKHMQLEADQLIAKVRNYQLVWRQEDESATTDPGRQFAAFISEFSRKGGEEENNVTVDVTLVITGDLSTITHTRP